MDVWQLIGRDHAKIEHLIHEAPRALDGAGVLRSRERLLGELIDELEALAEAVSVSLYAPLGRLPQTRRLVDALSDEHREFMDRLDDLARYRLKNSEGWLNAFEDATCLVERHLHRHKHELLPASRELLSESEATDAARAFIQARRWVIQGRRRPEPAPRSELDLKVIVCTLAVGLGYLLWQGGFLRGLGSRSGSGRRASPDNGWTGSDPATASMPDGRTTGGSSAQRRERLLDEGLEDTFPASDPVSAQRFT